MAFREAYRKQVELLIKILPFIAEEDCFALKGGTAINLFVRDMPRLSVDIDLTYLPVLPRSESLNAINNRGGGFFICRTCSSTQIPGGDELLARHLRCNLEQLAFRAGLQLVFEESHSGVFIPEEPY